MRLNEAQRVVIGVGLFVMGVAGLFPPWAVSPKYNTVRPRKYAFLFDPPSTVWAVDVAALLVVFGVVVAITLGLVVLLGIQAGASSGARGDVPKKNIRDVKKS